MLTFIKWIAVTVLAGLTWLVGNYTVEYFRPYHKKQGQV
jgi:hypothetical protein